jgi:formate hydrogenlyase subunit 4
MIKPASPYSFRSGSSLYIYGHHDGLYWPMLLWSTLLTLLMSGLILGPFGSGAPDWASQTATFAAVVAVFILVCLAEASGARSDKPSG